LRGVDAIALNTQVESFTVNTMDKEPIHRHYAKSFQVLAVLSRNFNLTQYL